MRGQYQAKSKYYIQMWVPFLHSIGTIGKAATETTAGSCLVNGAAQYAIRLSCPDLIVWKILCCNFNSVLKICVQS